MRSNSAESLEKKEVPVVSPRELHVKPKINQETRGIAALAAAKKRKQQKEMSNRLTLDPHFNRTFISSYGEEDSQLTPSRLASHNMKYSGSRYTLNDETESVATFDQRSMNAEAAPHQRKIDHSPGRGKLPRPTKYRPQPVKLPASKINQSHGSDRNSDKQTETPARVRFIQSLWLCNASTNLLQPFLSSNNLFGT